MFQSKDAIDKYIHNQLKKSNSEKERKQQGCRFAKLYYNFNDYESAKKFVKGYLSVVPNSHSGHRLLGDCLERLGKYDEALQSYKASYECDPTQKDLLLKVCDLLANDLSVDSSTAKFWAEQAERHYPDHPDLIKLRERLISLNVDSGNSEEVEKIILTELEKSPDDAKLRMQLLQHYLRFNRIADAYRHAKMVYDKIENSQSFENNIQWHETILEVLLRYERENTGTNTLTADFWLFQLDILNQLVTLTLNEEHGKNLVACTAVVFDFDQKLSHAFNQIEKSFEKPFVNEVKKHFAGQLFFHFATLIFKRAKTEQFTFKEAVALTIPLFLASYWSTSLEVSAPWVTQCTDRLKKLINNWHLEGSFRASQAGHCLLANWGNRNVDRIAQMCTGQWRENTFKSVFLTRDHHAKMNDSYFMKCSELSNLKPIIPTQSELIVQDDIAQVYKQSSLQNFIWIAMNRKTLSDFKLTAFCGLQFSVDHLSQCAAETLNQLDLLTFIYCTTLCAQAKREDLDRERPQVLPVSLTPRYYTTAQENWFNHAYKVSTNKQGHPGNLSNVRMIITQGIETLRCVGNHGLHVKLLVKLAEILTAHAKQYKEERKFVEARAKLFWTTAVPLLERMKNNQAIEMNKKNALFDYAQKDMTGLEINNYLEEAQLFIARQLWKEDSNDKALEILQGLKSPYASFYQAKIYKKLALDCIKSTTREHLTSEMRSQNTIMLSKARDCFYMTLDRLRQPNADANHPLNRELAQEIENIEAQLSRINPDMMINDFEESEADYSTVASVNGDFFNSSNILTQSHVRDSRDVSTPLRPRLSNLRNQSTPMARVRPSPERLEAQIRHMVATQDSMVSHVNEHDKHILEVQKSLAEEIRGLKDVMSAFTAVIHDFTNMKINVDKTRDDIAGIREIVDQIPVMRKEVIELRKEANNKTMNEEGLWRLLNDNDSTSPYPDEDPTYATSYSYPANNPRLATGAWPNNPTPALYPGIPNIPHIPIIPNLNNSNLNLGNLNSMYPAICGQMPPVAYDANAALQQLTDFRHLNSLAQMQVPPFNRPLHAGDVQTIITRVSDAFVSPTNIQTTSHQGSNQSQSFNQPTNVVITASDPVPTETRTMTQPVLSVTIPPEHLKANKSHNFQMPSNIAPFGAANVSTALPKSTGTFTFNAPSANTTNITTLGSMSFTPKSTALTTTTTPSSSILSSILFTPPKSSSEFKFEIKTPASVEKSRESNVSTCSEEDPMPDYKPICPLPDEIEVRTGEEEEVELFKCRAKLHRFVAKEWKERGIGDVKLLKNEGSGKVRLLMRRDKTQKICANHLLTKDMDLRSMPNNPRSFMWAANDYADEQVTLETFSILFKTPELAADFQKAFKTAQSNLKDTPVKQPENKSLAETFKSKEKASEKKSESEKKENTPKKPEFAFGSLNLSKDSNLKPMELFKPFVPEVSSTTNIFGAVTTSGSFKLTGATSTTTSTPALTSPSLFGNISSIKSTTPSTVPSLFGSGPVSTPPSTKPSLFSNTSVSTTPTTKPSLFGSEFAVNTGASFFGKKDDKPANVFSNLSFGFKSPSQEPTSKLATDADNNTSIEKVEEFEPTVDFKPVVPLPPLADVKTGEEDEDVLFNERAKLYRFEAETKEWKERGIGQMKILESGIVRLVMRREQVHKVCCNHKVTKDMKFTKSTQNPKSVSWGAQDFSENEPHKELFTIRFKDEETSEKFVETLNNVQARMDDASFIDDSINLDESNQSTDISADISIDNQLKSVSGFGEKFKPSVGSWSCTICYTLNKQDAVKCVACETPNPTANVKTNDDNKAKEEKPKSSWGDLFKPSTNSWSCKSCYLTNQSTDLTCVACQTPKEGQTSTVSKPISTVPSFNFGSNTGGFNFGIPQDKKETSSSTSLFSTTAVPSFSFGFGNISASLPAATNDSSVENKDQPDDKYVSDEGDHIHFDPIIPLPEEVAVITDEDENDVLYSHRAKLFRFDAGDWKERGIGDVKILRNKQTKKIRVLMRREKIHKVCLNHLLTPDVHYQKKDANSWIFAVNDFSEGVLELMKFAIRFKTEDIANRFMAAIDSAKLSLDGNQLISGSNQAQPRKDSNSSDEVVYVNEVKATDEQIALAKKLQLPENFYLYLSKAPCKGCKGCDEHSEDTNQTATGNASVKVEGNKKGDKTPEEKTTPQPKISLKQPTFNFGLNVSSEKSSSPSSIFGTPKTSEQQKPEQKTPTFGGKSIFGGNAQTKELFGQIDSQTSIFAGIKSPQIPTFSPQKSIFGGDAQPANKTLSQATLTFGASTVDNTLGKSLDKSASGGNIFSATSPFKFDGSSTTMFGGSSAKPTFSFAKVTSSESVTTADAKPVTTSSSSIFGGLGTDSKGTTPVFGSVTPVFGSTNKDSTTPTFGEGKAIFGTGKPSTFGSLGGSSIFDGNKSIFGGSIAKKTEEPENSVRYQPLKESDYKEIPVEGTFADKPKKGTFAFAGVGTPVFASLSKTSSGKSNENKSLNTTAGENETTEGDDDAYDPQYKPAVDQMPDEIKVVTGEEDEEILFEERVRMLRFDNKAEPKQWKERGVGPLKILFNPQYNSYRLLLRREQIYTIVLNERIVQDLGMTPVKGNMKSLSWSSNNFIEGAYVTEMLSLLFKNEGIAQKFKAIVDECVEKVMNQPVKEIPIEQPETNEEYIPSTVEQRDSDKTLTPSPNAKWLQPQVLLDESSDDDNEDDENDDEANEDDDDEDNYEDYNEEDE